MLEHAEGRLEHARSLLELGAALRRARQFVTIKAVEWHLHNVYRKLDISTRDELSGALAPRPQAPIPG